MLTLSQLQNSLTYTEYQTYSRERFAENKTTGEAPEVNTDFYLNYTKLNLSRTQRVEKRVELNNVLKAALDKITQPQNWVVLAESWCGDVPHSLPILHKIAVYQPLINLRILLRDNNLEVMDSYLTNGGRSIPKVIALRGDFSSEIFTWGPRPAVLQAEINQLKAAETPYSEIAEMSQKWYNKDGGNEIQKELLDCIKRT